MRCLWLLASLCALASTTLGQNKKTYPKSVQLSYELVGPASAASKPLATISYDPKSLEYILESWTPPLSAIDTLKSTSKEPTSSPLVRVLVPNGSSSVATLTAFDNSLSQDINIWIDAKGAPLSASVNSITPPALSAEEEALRQKEERLRKRGKPVPPRPKPKTTKSKVTKAKDAILGEEQAGPVVKVNLLVANGGPKPRWNTRATPQVDAEGREIVQEEEQEKTFLQKYWYILLALAFVLMSGGGGGGK